jgi:hypothetical protein
MVRAPEHHAVDLLQMLACGGSVGDTPLMMTVSSGNSRARARPRS